MATRKQIIKTMQKDVKLMVRKVLSPSKIDEMVERIMRSGAIDVENIENTIPVGKDIACALARELEFQWGCKKGMKGYRQSRKNINNYYGNI